MIDMFEPLKNFITRTPQDPGVDTSSIEPNVAYNLASRSDALEYGLSLDVNSLKVDAIKIHVGASQHTQPPVPAIGLELDVEGSCDINLGSFTLASAWVNNNRVTLETAAQLDAAGNITLVSWINDDPIGLGLSWGAALAAGVITAGDPLFLLGLEGLTAYIKDELVDPIIERLKSIIEDAILQTPRVMAMFLGANVDLTSLRIDDTAIVIDYVAPIEPDPKPPRVRHGYHFYTGVIGRSIDGIGTGSWQLVPPTLGDTWADANLSKIDHIVVVMMENRAFDHVLGYRAALPDTHGEDGLSEELIGFLWSGKEPGTEKQLGFLIRPLSESRIVPNAAGLKTRFPVQVGHKLANVETQLSHRLQLPDGRWINSPQGFVEDFASHIGHSGLETFDVLGYYTGADLPFYRFLAENYSYCERYFSAHPGPTLPNRMYSLAGDVQYDRTGEAILDNNNADNLVFSRALNIFDLLTRKNISWRVYESFPSVTMLRMFARYAGDNTNIVPISQLERDIADGNLPAVVFIDPAMHSAPENDDHPVADMLHGQVFIKRVYDTLRSNEAIWLKTMLIITYDEHGGFYDHVIPPAADALSILISLAGDALPMPSLSNGGPVADAPSFKADMIISYGLRVPTFVVSPWVPAGKGPDVTLDHCSILKTVLARFCNRERPFLSNRVHASYSFESFLTQTEPRLSQIPPSPTLPPPFAPKPRGDRLIVTAPVSRKALATGDVDFHDLTGMVARMLGRR
jgi:phospholipase C